MNNPILLFMNIQSFIYVYKIIIKLILQIIFYRYQKILAVNKNSKRKTINLFLIRASCLSHKNSTHIIPELQKRYYVHLIQYIKNYTNCTKCHQNRFRNERITKF